MSGRSTRLAAPPARPGRRWPRLGLVVALVALVALALTVSGCDGTTSGGRHRIAAGRLLVYTGVPLSGPEAASGRAVLDGERLALDAAHGRVGRYVIVLSALDDTAAGVAGDDPGQVSANATRAAGDRRTIGYIGDLDSGATAISLPLLNRADIPQISPLSAALGLTRGGPEASPGEPQKYYPSGVRTFARVVPNDGIQAAVQVALQRSAGCRRLSIVYDDEVEGRDAAQSVQVAAQAAGEQIVGIDQLVSEGPGPIAALAARVAKGRPDCVLVSALVSPTAVAVTDAVARLLPRARLFATAPLAQPAFADPARGGVAVSVDRRLEITEPGLPVADESPAGRRFVGRFERRYGADAGAGTGVWGDAAMALLLDSIRRASDDGRRDITRTRVLHAIFTTRRLPSVIGTYSIQPSGDTTLDRYGVARVVDGRLMVVSALPG